MNDEYEKPEPAVDVTPLPKTEQVALAEKLQAAVLRTFERRLKNGTLSDSGIATLVRLLMQNGWTIDPSQLSKGLRSVLTENVSPDELDDVLPFRKQA